MTDPNFRELDALKKNSSTLSKRLHIDGLSGNHQWAQILTFPNGKKINTDDPANSKLHNDLILYIFSRKKYFPTFYILHDKKLDILNKICTLKFLIRELHFLFLFFPSNMAFNDLTFIQFFPMLESRLL